MRVCPRRAWEPHIPKHDDAINDPESNGNATRNGVHLGSGFWKDGIGADKINMFHAVAMPEGMRR
jgi:hypothetical protein